MNRISRSPVLSSLLLAGLTAGLLPLSGCGESEAPDAYERAAQKAESGENQAAAPPSDNTAAGDIQPEGTENNTRGGAQGDTTQFDPKPLVPFEPGNRAAAVLEPTEGNTVNGQVIFQESGETILVVAEVRGLTPGKHGFHIHENGDCSAPDASSAGGHFNPTDAPHGGPDADKHHVGDLGNLEAGEDGMARLDSEAAQLELRPEHAQSIIGKAVIVHGDADDLSSQPSGAAGPRVACGVIKVEVAPDQGA